MFKTAKRISSNLNVAEEDNTSLISLWDKQYDQIKSVMGYDPHNRDAEKLFEKVKYEEEVEEEDDAVDCGKEKKKPRKRRRKYGKLMNVEVNIQKMFSSRSFYTTQAGVFRTKTTKRLGVSPSDKVIFPRHNFGAFSPGSLFGKVVNEFNSKVPYDVLLSDKHLNALCGVENHY